MKARLPMIATVLLSLMGCASLSYQEPQQGSRARVRFVTTSTAPTVLRAYDDAGCTTNETEWMRLRTGPLVNSSPKSLGMPLWNHHENAAKEVYVDAGKRLHGMFQGGEVIGLTMHSCGVPFAFDFAKDSDYEVKYHFIPRQCYVTISQIVPNGSDWSYKPLARFDNRTTPANAACLEQFKKIRLY